MEPKTLQETGQARDGKRKQAAGGGGSQKLASVYVLGVWARLRACASLLKGEKGSELKQLWTHERVLAVYADLSYCKSRGVHSGANRASS